MNTKQLKTITGLITSILLLASITLSYFFDTEFVHNWVLLGSMMFAGLHIALHALKDK